MSVPPTEPRYSTSGGPRFPVRTGPALAAFLLLVAIGVLALVGWWLF